MKQTEPGLSDTVSGPVERWLGLERKWWVLVAVGIGTVMGTLDLSIMNVVLPVIQESFATDLSSAEWVMMVYLLTVSILLLSFGRLGDILGHKTVYITGLVIFTLASVLCGLSPSMGFLIAFRALQALGAAMVSSNSPAILTAVFPAQQRGRGLGLLVTITYLGVMVGPSLGGYLSDHFGWRSIFFVNLPVGVMAAAMAVVAVPRLRSRMRREPFDLAGAGMLAVGLGALLLVLSKGQEPGWTSIPVIGLAAGATLFLALFFWMEQVLPYPMLDLGLFRNRLFTLASTSALLNYLCVFSSLFLVPFYLVQDRGFSPGLAGLLLTAESLGMIMIAPFSGYLSDRIGSRVLTTSGMLLLAAGLYVLHGLGPLSTHEEVTLPLLLIGLANGIFVTPNTSAILGSAPQHRQGIASGVVAMARHLGMVFGVAVAGAVFSMRLAQRGANLADAQEAFSGAFQDTFLLIAAIAALGALLSLVRGSGRDIPS